MFDTIADMLRGSAPDDLAHALGTDRTQTRRAMEIGLPALITGLRDKTLEPGGAQNLASMLDEPSAAVPSDLDAYLGAGDPSQGAAMLDVAFGDRGEPALGALSSASGLSTRLLAQVMSVLAPLATGTVAAVADRSPEGLRSYLSAAVEDLEGKGFGRVVELVSPGGGVLAEAIATADATDGATLVIPDVDKGAELDIVDELEFDDLDIDGPPMVDLDMDIDDGATVVEGAFPDAPDVVVVPDGLDLDVGGETIEIGDAMPSFDAEVASVAPAGVPIASASATTPGGVAIAPPAAPVQADPLVSIDQPELEGDGLSNMGWLWWIIGALLGIGILFYAFTQCGGSDDPVEGADTDLTNSTVEAVTPTPDVVMIARQEAVDAVLVNYPGVSAEIVGDVAVLTGSVGTQTELAELDAAVRLVNPGVNLQVTVTEVPVAAPEGFTLNDLIDVQPELTTLKALLVQAGLGDALSGNAELTLFAPTNAAFDKIPADQLTALQNDPQALQEALLYHLLPGPQDAASITASPTLATQLDGQTIAVDATGGRIVLNGTTQIQLADASARNGVMHVIDTVLLPPTEQALPEEIGAALGLAPINFASGSTVLDDAAKTELDKVVTFLLANPGTIEIGGHTDSDGDAALNQTISQDRADAVKDYLESQGIPAESLTAFGFGEDQPIAENDTPANKALNRRIEFRPAG